MYLLNRRKIFRDADNIPSTISGLQLWIRGDSVTDLSSNAYSITNTGVTITSSAINGKSAMEFNGTSAYLEVTNSVISGTGSRSIYIVYKSTRTGSGYVDAIAGKSQYGVTGTWFMVHSRNDVVGDPYLAGYADDLTGPTPDNAWKYVCVNYDGTTAKSYKNGTLANSGTKTLNTVANNFTIGADTYDESSIGRFLQGQIAEIIVYNTVLSSPDNTALNDYLVARYAL